MSTTAINGLTEPTYEPPQYDSDESKSLIAHARPYDSTGNIISTYVVALGLAIYLSIIGFITIGQQHMDWGVDIGAWAVLVTLGQIVFTAVCGYYWKKLKGKHTEYKVDLLILTTTAMAFLFILSNNVYFVLAYTPLFNTMSATSSFAQRQFDNVFNITIVALITLVPKSFVVAALSWKADK